MNLIVLTICLVALTSADLNAAVAEKANEVLSFQNWKAEQVGRAQSQVSRAQNKVVRATNEILLKQSQRYKSTQKSSEPGKNTEPSVNKEGRMLKGLQKSLAQAKQDLQISEELEFEDYLSVYLAQIEDEPTKVKALAEKLSTEEVAKTLLYLQRYKQRQAKSKSPIEKK